MIEEKVIQRLESLWGDGLFFDNVRRGKFLDREGEDLIDVIKSLTIEEDDLVPKRLVSLLWYVPIFLEWQKGRVREINPARSSAYDHFVTNVINQMEKALGVP